MRRSDRVALHSHWAYISLIPFGFGAWAPGYAGVKARRPLWIALGSVWTVMIVVALVLSSGHGHGNDGIVGALAIIAWVGGIATSFSIRDAYDRQMSSPLEAATSAAEQRLYDRRHAAEIAQRDPALAQEIGIGRPDRADADPAGLVDVNNANVTALMTLPGVNGDVATEIVETRERVGGFSSLEDCGATLDLDGGTVEALRGRVVFLPRRG
jgi:DNA uptake protein ComE-like DNA-binding protein